MSRMTKRYGIRMTLPADDPMRSPHLLGEEWEGFRWYTSASERDVAIGQLGTEDVYYRRGDHQSLMLEPIER